MTEYTLQVQNLSTNYKSFGSGKPLLLLHGWPSSSDRWEKVGELVGRKYLVVVPDLPGFGKTQQPPVAWSMDNYVEWVKAFVDAIPELRGTFYIAGHSFGGALAAKFSLKYTQRIEKLVMICAAGVRKKTGAKKMYYGMAKTGKMLSFLPGYETLRKGFYKVIVRRSDYLYQSGIMKETYLKVIQDDLSYKINFLKVPVVMIWGDKDKSTPLEEAQFLNQQIPDSKLEVIPGADHLLHVKVPEVLSEKLEAALA